LYTRHPNCLKFPIFGMVPYNTSYGDRLSVRLDVGDLRCRESAALMASCQNIISTFASNIILHAFAFKVRIIYSAVPLLCWVYRGEHSNVIPFSPSKPRNGEMLYSPDPFTMETFNVESLCFHPCLIMLKLG